MNIHEDIYSVTQSKLGRTRRHHVEQNKKDTEMTNMYACLSPTWKYKTNKKVSLKWNN